MQSIRQKGFWILTAILISTMISCIKATAMSMGNRERAGENHYYAELERDYVDRTQRFLEEEGYHNCGVNMLRVTNQDGSREYKILLHHRRFESMSAEEKTQFEKILGDMEFQDAACSFRYELRSC